MTAAQHGDLEAVMNALAHGSDVDALCDGRTALWFAAQEGHAAVVTALLDAGADVNCADPTGFSPLRQAVGESHTRIVEQLILRGAQVNHRCSSDGDSTPLHNAAAYGRLECIRLLLLYGADPEAKDDDGNTPYDTAIHCGEVAAATLLRGTPQA